MMLTFHSFSNKQPSHQQMTIAKPVHLSTNVSFAEMAFEEVAEKPRKEKNYD